MVSSRTGCVNYKRMGSKRLYTSEYAYTENPGWVYHAQIEACFGLVLVHEIPGRYLRRKCQSAATCVEVPCQVNVSSPRSPSVLLASYFTIPGAPFPSRCTRSTAASFQSASEYTRAGTTAGSRLLAMPDMEPVMTTRLTPELCMVSMSLGGHGDALRTLTAGHFLRSL